MQPSPTNMDMSCWSRQRLELVPPFDLERAVHSAVLRMKPQLQLWSVHLRLSTCRMLFSKVLKIKENSVDSSNWIGEPSR